VIEPLRLTYQLQCPADHAFEVWTTRIGAWWPKGHSVSGTPGTVVVLETWLGGRIFERATDGAEIDWGVVTQWSPPRRLGYTWHIGRDPVQATEVIMAVRHTELPIHGVQFHPESILTEGGHRMLANWLGYCGWVRDDTLVRRLENEVRAAVRPYFPTDPGATDRTSA
jgi:hypothetical protein